MFASEATNVALTHEVGIRLLLALGTTGNLTQTITGVYPIFATTANITTLTKQPLVSMTGYATFVGLNLVTEILSQPSDLQEIDIPDAWATITGAQFFNTISNSWDTLALSTWTTSPTSHTIQGVSVPYTKYTNNAGFPRGAGKYRFTV